MYLTLQVSGITALTTQLPVRDLPRMSATSLKLPEGLKRRITRLAGAANKTAHAFMVEALSQEADRAEIRERFTKGRGQFRGGNHGKRQGCSVGSRI